MSVRQHGANDVEKAIGVNPVQCLKGLMPMQNEITMHAPFREWARLMEAGVNGRKAYP